MKAFELNTKFMICLIVFLSWNGFLNPLLAQDNYITVSGVLKDAKNGDRISYAAIIVPGTGIGTVSNSEGEFTLKISAKVQAEYIEVSHLSYLTTRFKISESSGKHMTFLLEFQPVQLMEFSVVNKDALSLVEMAIKKIKDNYSQEPVMMTGFYREFIMQRRDYISVSEAVVDIYKAPYSGFQNDRVRIFKGRKGTDVKRADTLMVQLQGGPKVQILMDVVRNPDLSIAFDDLDNYSFEIESIANIDNKLNWVITFTPFIIYDVPLFYGKIYICQEDMAITRVEFSRDLSDPLKAAGMLVKKKPMGLVFLPTATSYLVTYKKEEGLYYLNYTRVDLKFKCDWKKKIFKNNYQVTSELAITSRSRENIEKFEMQESFESTMVFSENVDYLADPDFWGEYNIIEQEESIENAIKKLSKVMQK